MNFQFRKAILAHENLQTIPKGEFALSMKALTHSSGRSPYQRHQEELRRDRLWQFGLWLIALSLLGLNLGHLPLLDTREGILPQLAQDLSSMVFDRGHWQLALEQQPLLEQNPLVPALIALAYHWGGTSVWMTRLPGAIVASFSIPLIYSIGREIFPASFPAIFSAFLYLTFFPVIYEGRLATENGALLCFSCLVLLSCLRSRRDLRWSLGIGLSSSAILLTQLQSGMLVGLIAGLFIAWDTPRLWKNGYVWLGTLLGLIPALLWYGWQLENGSLGAIVAISPMLPSHWQQSLPRVLSFLPGLVFTLAGLRRAWQSRLWGWAKLVLVWVGVSLVGWLLGAQSGIIFLGFPALALAGGIELAESRNLPSDRDYPRHWRTGLWLFVGAIAWVGINWIVNPDPIAYQPHWRRIVMVAAQLLTLGVTIELIKRRDPQFVYTFFWGLYVFSLLFVMSPYWTGLL